MANITKIVLLIVALSAINAQIENFDMDFDLEKDTLMVNETIKLEPNSPFEFANPLFFKVKVSCRVTTLDASDSVEASILKGSAKLNGQDVGAGIKVEVKNGDTLTIEASGSAKARLTNLGSQVVTADCGLGEESLQQVEYLRQVLNNAVDEREYYGDNDENVYVEYQDDFQNFPVEYEEIIFQEVGVNEAPRNDDVDEEEVVDQQFINEEAFLANILN